ncbi:MAG: hypothetical protein WBW32_14830 [Luteibacter sp.]
MLKVAALRQAFLCLLAVPVLVVSANLHAQSYSSPEDEFKKRVHVSEELDSKGLSVDQAKAKAEELTRTVYQGAHLYPELEEPMSPGFYGLELHWDQAVEGGQVAAFLQVDKLNGNVFEVSGVTCYQYGHDKKMHEVHPHGTLRLPDVCM